MREIKFRAWDKEDKQMIYDIQDASKVRDSCDYQLGTNPFNFFLMHGVFEVMQYTGLKDKNGKEIYEGDIVHTFSRVGRGFRDRGIDEVHYSDITARWYPLSIVVTEKCEVIGNIYENPELLEK